LPYGIFSKIHYRKPNTYGNLMSTRSIVLEVCIDRFASAEAAVRGGADRIEVCGALGAEGVTPSIGLVEQCMTLSGVSRMVMMRPHEGGFCYDESDIQTMLTDIARIKATGAEGIVIGALQSDQSIDRETCRRLIDAARPMEVTFHRAFDVTPEPLRALDALIELGCDRLLTSGRAALAVDGVKVLRELVLHAGNDLNVIAGTGICGRNVQALVESTGVPEVHISGSRLESVTERGEVCFGRQSRVTQEEKVRAVRRAIDEAL
jgi:copper homeostasis protein